MEVMEAIKAQARANLFVLGFMGGSKSSNFAVFWTARSSSTAIVIGVCISDGVVRVEEISVRIGDGAVRVEEDGEAVV